MNKFEQYLVNNGIHYRTANKYGSIADKYLNWLKENKLEVLNIRRSVFTEWLQLCREQGNSEPTIIKKEGVIKHYYYFLGAKNNPAKSWIKNERTYKIPPSAIDKTELKRIYTTLNPKTPSEYRNRCMLGLVLFQGLKRSELEELRTFDLDLENGYVVIQGQLKTNRRTLLLESSQILHLNEYNLKYRSEFIPLKKSDTGRLFLSKGNGDGLNNSISRMLIQIRRKFPQIKNLIHIRSSVIANWLNQDGVMEAKVFAGLRYITSVQRYQTSQYDALKERLKTLHPLEHLNIKR